MGFGRGEGGEKWEPDRREGSATTEMVSAMGTSYPRHCVTARVTLRSSGQHLLREYWHAHIGIPCAGALACAGAGGEGWQQRKGKQPGGICLLKKIWRLDSIEWLASSQMSIASTGYSVTSSPSAISRVANSPVPAPGTALGPSLHRFSGRFGMRVVSIRRQTASSGRLVPWWYFPRATARCVAMSGSVSLSGRAVFVGSVVLLGAACGAPHAGTTAPLSMHALHLRLCAFAAHCLLEKAPWWQHRMLLVKTKALVHAQRERERQTRTHTHTHSSLHGPRLSTRTPLV